jgi:hypothetical protein
MYVTTNGCIYKIANSYPHERSLLYVPALLSTLDHLLIHASLEVETSLPMFLMLLW